MTNFRDIDLKLVSLHKHWLTADAIKEFIPKKVGGAGNIPKEIEPLAELWSMTLRLSVFYGLLYVVVEGYKSLRVSNQAIDNLLKKTTYVDALRRFRNATFHYQKKPISEKTLFFFEMEKSEIWTKELHFAFKKYFEETLPIQESITRLTPK